MYAMGFTFFSILHNYVLITNFSHFPEGLEEFYPIDLDCILL